MTVPTAASTATEPTVLTRLAGSALHVTLNRPRAINALTLEMFQLLDGALTEAADGGARLILLDGAGERGFCGGGDIKAMSADGARDAHEILSTEYDVDHRIATSAVPVVGIMDGVTMGGGLGLTAHAALRVVTERSLLAMPEARIGIVPDVGGNVLFARAPGRIGELLAITAGTMDAGDAIALGFADAFVRSERLPDLYAALAAIPDAGDALVAARAAVHRFAEPAPESALLAARAWFDPLADAALGDAVPSASATIASVRALITALEASDDARATETAATVRAMNPVSVAVAIARIAATRALDAGTGGGQDDPARTVLRRVLDEDLRVLTALATHPNFAEGVRAQVIDKDRRPRWQPTRIEELGPDDLAVLGSTDAESPLRSRGDSALES